MSKYYKAYKDLAVVEMDVEDYINRSVESFESYLLAVKEAFKEYEAYILHLEKHLPKRESIALSYKDFLLSYIECSKGGITADSFHRLRYLPQYIRLKCLVDIIGRKEAISFTKSYIDRFISKMPKRSKGPKSIEDLRLMQIEFNIKGGDMDWIGISMGPRAYCNIVTKCRISELFKAYDAQLMEVICCYPDFESFRAINPHFVLTRNQTLIGGGSYCDTCYHDDRLDFKHPSQEWFERQMALYLKVF